MWVISETALDLVDLLILLVVLLPIRNHGFVCLYAGPAKDVPIFDADALTRSRELFILPAIGKNDSECIPRTVNLKSSCDCAEHNVTRFAAGNDEPVDRWAVVFHDSQIDP